MISKDLSRLIQQEGNQEESPEMQSLMKKLKDKPFWTWHNERHREQSNPRDINTHGHCCFNHIIGLPTKGGQEKSMFDYEHMLYKSLMQNSYLNSDISQLPRPNSLVERDKMRRVMAEKTNADFRNKHVWIKKATGLGVTEFMLRLMAWLCLRNDDYRNSQMVIVTGPNQDIAIKLIKRMKALFERHGITFDSKETVIELNGCSIEAYPSNHIDACRSLSNPKIILIDEGDFFRMNEQESVRMVAERYIGKSDPYIVIVSTPNAPDGLMQKIEKEPFETCIYKKIFLDYTYGIDKIYTREEIEKAKMSPSFRGEYMLEYQGLIGNVFSHQLIERCQQIEYNPQVVILNCKISVGIDPSFGSSKFGIVVTRYANGRIEVIEAEEHERPDFSVMIDRIWQIKRKHGITTVYCDAANPEIWQSLKKEFKEDSRSQYVVDKLAWCKKNSLDPANYMIVVPVPFSTMGGSMLQHCKSLVEDADSLVAIHPSFDKLLIGLRTAVATDYKLNKEETSYDDIVDAFRLSLQFYKMGK
jgi:hypothetical protein